MRALKIPKGNDCYVKANVKLKINGGDESMDTVDIDLNHIEGMNVTMVDILGKKTTITEWAVSQTESNVLFLKVTAGMKTGHYGLEITGKWNDRDVTWYEEEAIWIVMTAEEADTAVDTYMGFDCFHPDDPIVVQFSGVVFPYLKVDLSDGYLYADKIPDGGNFTIENGYLTAEYIDEGSAW